MKNTVWAKTILTAYNHLERICDAIDKVVETKAVNSFYVTGANFMTNNISSVASKIIDLTERKITLINLKVLTLDALSACGEINAELLIEKYIDGEKNKAIAEKYNLSTRTYFRRLAGAEGEFLEKVSKLGYKERNLFDMLKNESWLMNIYENINNNSEELSNSQIDKLAFAPQASA